MKTPAHHHGSIAFVANVKTCLCFVCTCVGIQLCAQPTISSFMPISGPVGTVVTINGANFNPFPDSNIVFFGAVRAIVKEATSTSLTVVVPKGTTYEPLSVLNTANGLTGYSSLNFIATFGTGGAPLTDSSFAENKDFPMAAYGIVLSDIDGDGKPDIVTGGQNAFSVLRNIGDSSHINFAAKEVFNASHNIGRIIAKDLNGDGKPDISAISSTYDFGKIALFKNTSVNGHISFIDEGQILTGDYLLGKFVVDDMDNDGKADIVVLSQNKISIYKNTSVGAAISFIPGTDIESELINDDEGSEHNATVTTSDLDSDGRPEIILAIYYSSNYTTWDNDNNLAIFRNTGVSGIFSFAPPVYYNLDGHYSTVFIETGDLNGDNKPDIVSHRNWDNSLFVNGDILIIKNNSTLGNISLAEASYLEIYNSGSAAICDLDGDGKPDLVASSSNNTLLFKNNSENERLYFMEGVPIGKQGYNFSISDLEGDTRPDLAFAPSDKFSILRNEVSAFSLFSITSANPYVGKNISFADQSKNAFAWQWDFDGDGTFDSEEQNPLHVFTAPGIYNVRHRINNDPLLEKLIPITIVPNRGTPYLLTDGGNFEVHIADFAAYHIGASSFSRGKSIYEGKNGTYSGSNVWVIDKDYPKYKSNATAYLYSPSFNCSATGDYTISFYAKYNIENTWDGFRVEFSTDSGDTWQILGDTVKTNWYDYANPSADRPFPQDEAFFSLTDASVYKLKIFTTNIFQGNSSVGFRIIFKSDYYEEGVGLAIDDFTLTGPENVVLPISLPSFTGYNSNNRNILNWKTSTEINSSRYEVERSLDAHNFVKIGTVQSINNTSGAAYKYTDDISHVYANNFYYRLKMIDKDGSYNYSPVVAIAVNKKDRITILGNPAGQYINIVTPASMLQKPLQSVIYDINGNRIKSVNISNTSIIVYVDKMAAGKYFISFVQDGNIVQTGQFIKQ